MPDQADFLAQLDDASQNGVFPYPQHDRMDYGAMRMHAYKGTKAKDGFALVFEMLMFDHEAHRIEEFHGFCNHVFVFHSSGESITWDSEALPSPIKRVPKQPSVSLTEDNDEHIEMRKDRQCVNPKASAILLRGKQVPVPHDAKAYTARGIKPSKPIAMPDLLRYLIAGHRDEIFSTDAERAKLLPRMTKLLTLDRWRHYTLDDGAPSDTEAMQMLADVLVTGDVSKYAPTEKQNTDVGLRSVAPAPAGPSFADVKRELTDALGKPKTSRGIMRFAEPKTPKQTATFVDRVYAAGGAASLASAYPARQLCVVNGPPSMLMDLVTFVHWQMKSARKALDMLHADAGVRISNIDYTNFLLELDRVPKDPAAHAKRLAKIVMNGDATKIEAALKKRRWQT